MTHPRLHMRPRWASQLAVRLRQSMAAARHAKLRDRFRSLRHPRLLGSTPCPARLIQTPTSR